MDAAGAGGGDADSEAASVFGVADGGEGGSLFVADLDEADLVLAGAEGFEDAVHAVAGEAEDDIDFPIDEPVYEYVAHCFCHRDAPNLNVGSGGSRWSQEGT